MDWWQAIVLGLVEGITEYLPISSTGHLIVAGDLMGMGRTPDSKAALDAFNIIIQGGAILAVLALYWPRFLQMVRGVLGRDPAGLRLAINVAIAFVPAAALGVVLKKHIEHHLFFLGPVVAMFILGGVYMILVDRLVIAKRRKAQNAGEAGAGKDVTDLTPRGALLIGLLQCISMWPGTSRSMMTITGGIFAGLKPAAAAEFSFLLGMPTLLAATGYTLYKDISNPGPGGNVFQQFGPVPTILGLLVAAVSAWLAVKWLVGFLNRHGLTPFGVYRIVFGLLLLGLAMAGLVDV